MDNTNTNFSRKCLSLNTAYTNDEYIYEQELWTVRCFLEDCPRKIQIQITFMNFDNWHTGVLLKTADGNRDKNKTSFATMYWSRLQEEQTQVTELLNTAKSNKTGGKNLRIWSTNVNRKLNSISGKSLAQNSSEKFSANRPYTCISFKCFKHLKTHPSDSVRLPTFQPMCLYCVGF